MADELALLLRTANAVLWATVVIRIFRYDRPLFPMARRLELIEAAIARHTEAEMRCRRQAMLIRVTGGDASALDIEREEHHKAVVRLSKEIAPFDVRRAA